MSFISDKIGMIGARRTVGFREFPIQMASDHFSRKKTEALPSNHILINNSEGAITWSISSLCESYTTRGMGAMLSGAT